MGWQITPYSVPLATAGAGIGGLAIVAYKRRRTRGGLPLVGVLVATALWCVADAVSVSSTSIVVKRLSSHVSVFGQVGVTTCVFLFAAEYTNRELWVTRRRVAGLFSVHLLTLGVVWTSPFHDLLIESDSLTEGTRYVYHQIQWGPWNAFHTAYAYLLLLGAAWMLIGKLRQAGDVGTYRGQTIAILVGMAVPWGMSVAYHTEITEADLTALGFTVTGTMVAVALFRYRILDVVPVARSTTIDTIDQGYLVLDPENTLVDVNETASTWLGADQSTLIGQQFRDVFREYPGILERFTATRRARELASLDIDGEKRYFDVDISPIYDRRDRYTGRVCLFQDVTERERHKRRLEHHKSQLETQNERLEEFAGIVAHDLRSPLAVFSGYLELLDEEHDSDHVETMQANVTRMEDIIDDVLELARKGQTVQATDQVAIATACQEAWRHVDTRVATLRVETSKVVDADADRLDRVFENLFRNSIEHGTTSNSSPDSRTDGIADAREDAEERSSSSPRSTSSHEDAAEHSSASPPSPAAQEDAAGSRGSSEPSVADAPEDAEERSSSSPRSASPREDARGQDGSEVTIVVGDLEDGFYVEDDGPGIPPEERDAILKKGYSTADGGTGFGLSIVTSAVEAHGWEIDVTCAEGVAADDRRVHDSSPSDKPTGARFEITGVRHAVEQPHEN